MGDSAAPLAIGQNRVLFRTAVALVLTLVGVLVGLALYANSAPPDALIRTLLVPLFALISSIFAPAIGAIFVYVIMDPIRRSQKATAEKVDHIVGKVEHIEELSNGEMTRTRAELKASQENEERLKRKLTRFSKRKP